jgi:hypothetical protein
VEVCVQDRRAEVLACACKGCNGPIHAIGVRTGYRGDIVEEFCRQTWLGACARCEEEARDSCGLAPFQRRREGLQRPVRVSNPAQRSGTAVATVLVVVAVIECARLATMIYADVCGTVPAMVAEEGEPW